MRVRSIQNGLFVVLFIVLSTGIEGSARAEERCELILKGGRVIDGTGAPWYFADVAVRGGKIAAIGRLNHISSDRVVDVTGLCVAPGFIDMMGQTGGAVAQESAGRGQLADPRDHNSQCRGGRIGRPSRFRKPRRPPDGQP